MSALHEILHPERLTAVVDVGAAGLDRDPPYWPLLRRRLCTVAGFEPQVDLWPRRTAGLQMSADVIGDGSVATLHICHAPGMTSLLVPDLDLLRCFAGFHQWGTILREKTVRTRRLDDIEEIEAIDFLKVDAQGSELAVLDGARAKLSGAVVVEAEVSFVPLYRGQPMFCDIDQALGRAGFLFHMFAEISRRMIVPYPGSGPYESCNQVQSADAVYVRNFCDLEAVEDEPLKHLALIAHYCFRSFDLAYRCVQTLADRGGIPARAAALYLSETLTAEVA